MKRVIYSVLAIVLIGAGSAFAAELTPQAALDAARQWADAVGRADAAALETLVADDYVHIHATALVEDKRRFIDALKSGARKYDPIVLEDAGARTYGNTALVGGRFNLKAFTQGRTIEGVNRITLVFVSTPDGLKAVSFQATPIPKP